MLTEIPSRAAILFRLSPLTTRLVTVRSRGDKPSRSAISVKWEPPRPQFLRSATERALRYGAKSATCAVPAPQERLYHRASFSVEQLQVYVNKARHRKTGYMTGPWQETLGAEKSRHGVAGVPGDEYDRIQKSGRNLVPDRDLYGSVDGHGVSRRTEHRCGSRIRSCRQREPLVHSIGRGACRVVSRHRVSVCVHQQW